MVRITEDLVRKRAEHNELQISTLEEISLHQQDIERIEHIDRWCRDLKILYLQSNLIPKIENVSRLKKLEYINLALNNVERVENLEGCESLKKLDLTVNFVGELTSIESLKDNYNFRELFLTGNPCTDYEHYREFVVATLPQLQWLDGSEIEKSERIKAIQDLPFIRGSILEQQERHRKKRMREKAEAQQKEIEKQSSNNTTNGESLNDMDNDNNKNKKPGFDKTWYTEINEEDKKKKEIDLSSGEDNKEKSHEEKVDDFWKEKVPYTPESRVDIHNHLQDLKEKDTKKDESDVKAPRRLFADDGRPFNVNEPKADFTLTEDEQNIILDIHIFRHMDTSLLDCDVQPNYVRITMKGKILQLCLSEEVNGTSSSAKRSQTTGNLLITMPKVKQTIKPAKKKETKPVKDKAMPSLVLDNKSKYLEVDASARKGVDVTNIVSESKEVKDPKIAPFGTRVMRSEVMERTNSADFVDDPDVPPLL